MLAELRRGAADRAGGCGEPGGDVREAQRPQVRVLHRAPEAGGRQMGIVDEVVGAIDRHGRNVRGIERFQPFGAGAPGEQLAERRVDLVDVREPARQGPEPRVRREVGPAGDLEQRRPLPVGVGEDADPAVPGTVRAPAGGERPRIAHRPPRRLVGLPVEVLEHVEPDQGLEHRHLDALAFAGQRAMHERRQHRDGGVQARHLVGDDGGDVAGLAVRRLQRRQPRHRLDHVVVGGLVPVRPGAAEAVRAAVDDRGVAGAHRRVVEPERVDRLRAHVVHERIRALHEPHHRFEAAGVLEVEHDPALVAVVGEEDRAHAVLDRRRSGAAHRVAAGGFDLDHVRAQIAEHLGGDGAEEDRGEVDDPHPREGAGRGAGPVRARHQSDPGGPVRRPAARPPRGSVTSAPRPGRRTARSPSGRSFPG